MVVVVRPPTTITIDLPVMVVPVAVDPVVEPRMEVTAVKEVRVRRDKVLMVRDREITGTQVVVVVQVRRVTVETVPVVKMLEVMVVMV